MKIAFACPSYGPIDPEVAHMQRHAIMTAWRNGIEVRSDIFVDRAGWDASRNIIAKAVVDELLDFDGVFWCDADSVLTSESIYNLVAPGVDVCTGIYYGRHPPFEPRIYVYNEPAESFNRILRWPGDGALFPVHACGFGAVYTSRRALEMTQQVSMSGETYTTPEGKIVPIEERWWFRTAKFSEDLTWCTNARAAGLVIWCNPNVIVDHLGEVEKINRKQYEQWAKEHGEGIVQQAMTLVKHEDGKYEAVVAEGLRVTPEPTYSVALSEEMRMTPSA